MEFEQSALMFDVNQILNAGANPVHFSLSASIFVDATGRIVNPLKVTSVDLQSRLHEPLRRRADRHDGNSRWPVRARNLSPQRRHRYHAHARADDGGRGHGRCGARDLVRAP